MTRKEADIIWHTAMPPQPALIGFLFSALGLGSPEDGSMRREIRSIILRGKGGVVRYGKQDLVAQKRFDAPEVVVTTPQSYADAILISKALPIHILPMSRSRVMDDFRFGGSLAIDNRGWISSDEVADEILDILCDESWFNGSGGVPYESMIPLHKALRIARDTSLAQKHTGFIYKGTMRSTGKFYIGKTNQYLYQRWYQHKYAAKQGSQTLWHKHMREHGINEVYWEVLEIVHGSQHDLDTRESYHIRESNALHFLNAGGLNLRS